MIDTTATDDVGLGKAFRWLTRTGAGRHFGSIPIGWYQIHQCHALDAIRGECLRLGLDASKVIVRGGRYRAPFMAGRGVGWCELSLTTRDVFRIADDKARA